MWDWAYSKPKRNEWFFFCCRSKIPTLYRCVCARAFDYEKESRLNAPNAFLVRRCFTKLFSPILRKINENCWKLKIRIILQAIDGLGWVHFIHDFWLICNIRCELMRRVAELTACFWRAISALKHFGLIFHSVFRLKWNFSFVSVILTKWICMFVRLKITNSHLISNWITEKKMYKQNKE